MGNVGWRQKNILGGSLGLLSARQRQRRRRRPTAVERSKSTDHRRMDAMLGVDASVRAACCYPPAPQLESDIDIRGVESQGSVINSSTDRRQEQTPQRIYASETPAPALSTLRIKENGVKEADIEKRPKSVTRLLWRNVF
uniref:Uncharacterized protein n=1 Tax=Ascaris lumbricoides TaxID=6252 RepID=A0A0M3I6F1_ASCLU